MIKLKGKEYFTTKEFSDKTGIPESTLKSQVDIYPNTTIKCRRQRFWDEDAYDEEFQKGRGVRYIDRPGPKRKLEVL